MKNKRYVFVSSLVLLGLWWWVSYIVNHPLKVPSPGDTLTALWRIVLGPNFLNALRFSLGRVLQSFTISFVLGVVLGGAAGIFKPVFYFLQPIVIIQRAMPTMGVILLALIWLSRENAPILVGVLIVFPMIYAAIVKEIRDVDAKLLEMAKVYQFSPMRKVRYIYLPSIQHALMAISAAAISMNVKVSIAAEVLSQPKFAMGTGFQMERVSLNTAGILAWSLIAIILGAILEGLVGVVLKRRSVGAFK